LLCLQLLGGFGCVHGSVVDPLLPRLGGPPVDFPVAPPEVVPGAPATAPSPKLSFWIVPCFGVLGAVCFGVLVAGVAFFGFVSACTESEKAKVAASRAVLMHMANASVADSLGTA